MWSVRCHALHSYRVLPVRRSQVRHRSALARIRRRPAGSQYRRRSRPEGALRVGYSCDLHRPKESGEASRGSRAVSATTSGCRSELKSSGKISRHKSASLMAAAGLVRAHGFVRHRAFAAFHAVVNADLADGTKRLVVKGRNTQRRAQFFVELPKVLKMRRERRQFLPFVGDEKLLVSRV